MIVLQLEIADLEYMNILGEEDEEVGLVLVEEGGWLAVIDADEGASPSPEEIEDMDILGEEDEEVGLVLVEEGGWLAVIDADEGATFWAWAGNT